MLTGYSETMAKFEQSENWDLAGVIEDALASLKDSTDEGSAVAVIEVLRSRLEEIRNVARADRHAFFRSDRCKSIELMCDELLTD